MSGPKPGMLGLDPSQQPPLLLNVALHLLAGEGGPAPQMQRPNMPGASLLGPPPSLPDMDIEEQARSSCLPLSNIMYWNSNSLVF